MKVGEQIFSPKALFWMIALGILAFGGAAYFLIYGDSRVDRAIGTDAYSYSAIGHRAFVETLRRQDIPVRISRNNSADKASYSNLLIIAEPHGQWADGNITRYLLPARRVLIVLPKHYGVRDDQRRKWVKRVLPLDIEVAEEVLHSVAPDSKVLRREAGADWGDNEFAATPDIGSPQLMRGDGLIPLIADREGNVLFARVAGRNKNIWLLGDPDILSNHGLGKGENAQLVIDMVKEMMPRNGGVIVDETVHGFYHSPSLWRHVFELPFAAVTILVIFSVLMLVWAAAGRFGAPFPAAAPAAAGKEGLIEITARLLNGRAHGHYILRRYQDSVFRDVARLLHAPHKFGEPEFDEWLDRAAETRGVKIDAAELRDTTAAIAANARGDGAQAAHVARKLFLWKQEMADGPRSRSSAPPGR